MRVNAEIKNLCRQIVEKFQPEKIILFGSYAYGKPNADSDVDLLVVMPFEGRTVNQAIKIRQNISGKMPLDLLVRTPGQIKERLSLGDFYIREIIERGKVLYESGNAGVD
jgi:predicted nucleotidyltransferase